MKTLVNSNIFPIISVAMYGTFISAESLFDDYQINQDFEEGYINYNSEYFWDRFDNKAFEKHIERLAQNYIDGKHECNGIEIEIKAGSIYSPIEYNFANDNIDLTVIFNKQKVAEYAKDNKNEFNVFLRENYSSYDGFISFTANNYNEWLADFKANKGLAIGAVLTFIFDEQIKDNKDFDSFAEYVYGNTSYSEFCDTLEIDIEITKLNDFVQLNYVNLDLDSVTDEFIEKLIDTEFLPTDRAKELIKAQFNNINDKSLTLF